MEDLTYEQKYILANTIENINDKKILKQIKNSLTQHNIKYQKIENEIICHFHNLPAQVYIDLQKIVDDYNNRKQQTQSLSNVDSDTNLNAKLKNSQKRIINKYNYQIALEKTIKELKDK